MPIGLYKVCAKEAKVNDVVVINPQYNAEKIDCVYPKLPLIKRIIASKSDHICLKNNRTYVNSDNKAPIRHTDSLGYKIPEISLCRTLKSSEFFVMGDDLEDSFDSRYFGVVSKSQIKSFLKPLIIW